MVAHAVPHKQVVDVLGVFDGSFIGRGQTPVVRQNVAVGGRVVKVVSKVVSNYISPWSSL